MHHRKLKRTRRISFPHGLVGAHLRIGKCVRQGQNLVSRLVIPAIKRVAVPCDIKFRDLRPLPGPKIFSGNSVKIGRVRQRMPCLSRGKGDPVCPSGHAAVAGMEQARARLGIEFNDRRLPIVDRIRRNTRGSHGKYHDCRQKLRQLCFQVKSFFHRVPPTESTHRQRPLQSHPVFFRFYTWSPAAFLFLRRNSSFP